MDRPLVGFLAFGAAAAAVAIGAVAYSEKRRRAAALAPRFPQETAGAGGFGRAVGSVEKGGMTLTHYRGRMPIKERIGIAQDLVHKSVQDPEMRKLALQITKHCPARDGKCEARAIYDWVRTNIRYTGDVGPHKLGRNGPVEGVDLFQSAARTVEFGGGDCLPAGTLLLVEGHKLVAIEDLIIGSRIWGRDKWTSVKDVWFKGSLPVDVVFLNNGSSFKATADHKVYVALCNSHPVRWTGGSTCSCPMSERTVERIALSQVEPSMVLVQPERIDFGSREMDPGRAYVEGLYLSDGFSSHDADFAISGQDGCPKEEQKREVQAICERLGISTRWDRKSIAVKDAEWALRMQQMGSRAWQKHALAIDLTEDAARELLRGIMADSGRNTNGNGRTFTTTSRELMLQTRMLHRMLGMSCSERYIVDHGGLGEHPIWRLGVRDTNRSDGHAEKLLRVKSIERSVTELPVYDISTEDHYVYLPEADVTVSNCDDHSVAVCTLAALNGMTCNFRVTSPTKRIGEDYTHIYPMVGLPKTRPSKFVALDTTLPGDRFGYEVPFGKKIDAPA